LLGRPALSVIVIAITNQDSTSSSTQALRICLVAVIFIVREGHKNWIIEHRSEHSFTSGALNDFEINYSVWLVHMQQASMQQPLRIASILHTSRALILFWYTHWKVVLMADTLATINTNISMKRNM
jgi:hypothetical protein